MEALGEVGGDISGDAGGECGKKKIRGEVGHKTMESLETTIGSDSISSGESIANGSVSENFSAERLDSAKTRERLQVCRGCTVMAKRK